MNAEANARIKVIWSIYRGDRLGRRYFSEAERAWGAYVRAECTSSSGSWIDPAYSKHQYVRGTSAPINYGLCAQKLTSAHIRELTGTISDLCYHAENPARCRRGQ